MDRKLRNRILLYLLLAGVLAYGLIELSGRKPAPKISGVRLLRAQEGSRNAESGGKPEIAAQVSGDLSKGVANRDRLQKNHDALVRLMAEQAATKDELATNELALTNAQAEVTRLQAVKQ